MKLDTLDTLDATIARLQGVRNCSIENGDIHDHYDCRNDLKMAVADLTNLLMACLPALEAEARAHNWLRVTESVNEEARL